VVYESEKESVWNAPLFDLTNSSEVENKKANRNEVKAIVPQQYSSTVGTNDETITQLTEDLLFLKNGIQIGDR